MNHELQTARDHLEKTNRYYTKALEMYSVAQDNLERSTRELYMLQRNLERARAVEDTTGEAAGVRILRTIAAELRDKLQSKR